ncbi:MAG: DUF4089 domain-containing protein [Halieaceae bacterium]|jgi:hypothetical protein|nr:DUF4089 domain-containing protein [Halieaceae bacterium]
MATDKDQPQSDPATLLAEQPQLLHDLAALAGVAVPPEHAQAVRGHLVTAARMASLLYAVPLDDHAMDGAPVFTPADGPGGKSGER